MRLPRESWRGNEEFGRTRSVLLPSTWARPGPPVICSRISTTATTNSRPKKASSASGAGGCVVHAAVFSAMQGTEIWSCPCCPPALASRQRPQAWPLWSSQRASERPDHSTVRTKEKRGARPYAGTGTRCMGYHRLLLPSHQENPQAGTRHCFGFSTRQSPNLSDPRHAVN